jgi:tripartite-type tricarboxylate transporter receptor subunit TctC
MHIEEARATSGTTRVCHIIGGYSGESGLIFRGILTFNEEGIMMRKTKNTIILVIATVLLCTLIAVSSVASAASTGWRPDHQIRLVVAGTAGGGFSVVMRLITPKLEEALGQPWLFDHRGGAGGTIAAEIVAHAKPDGHTVVILNGLLYTVTPMIYKVQNKKMPYKTEELVVLCSLTRGQYMLVAHPSVEANNLKEFIALAKRKPAGFFNYAVTGWGAPTHLGGELLSMRAGISMTGIPYKGGAKAVAAVLGGEIHLTFCNFINAVPFVKEGRVKALGVSGPARSPLMPEIPTIAEQGLPGYDVSTWYGLFMAAKTSEQVLRTLQTEITKALHMPDVKERIERLGLEVYFKRTNEIEDEVRNTAKGWAKVIEGLKIKEQ